MIIDDVTNEECREERTHIQLAYHSFVMELEYINAERGLLLQEATHALEEAAAEKLRQHLRTQTLQNGN